MEKRKYYFRPVEIMMDIQMELLFVYKNLPHDWNRAVAGAVKISETGTAPKEFKNGKVFKTAKDAKF